MRLPFIEKIFIAAIQTGIRFYRAAAPGLGFLFPVSTHCKFYPTCSHYAEETLTRRGLIAGLPLVVKRILSCRPGNSISVDPVVHRG